MRLIMRWLPILSIIFFVGCGGSKEKAIQRKVISLEKEASLAMSNKDFKTAEEKFLKAMELDPKLHSIRNNLAILYAKFLNQPEKAKDMWTGLLQEMPQNSAYLNNLAGIYQSEKSYEKALELYAQAKEFHTTYHMPYYNVAQIMLQQGRYKEAVEEMRQGVSLAPGDATMLVSLCFVLILDNQITEAQNLLESEYNKNPGVSIIALNYLRLLKREGKLEDADKIADGILKNNPQHALALAEKIDLAIDLEKPVEEIKVLLSRFDSIPDPSMKPWFSSFAMARIEFDKDNFEMIIGKLESLAGQIPASWKYFDGIRYHHLANLYSKSNQQEKASVARDKSKELAPELFLITKQDSLMISEDEAKKEENKK